jgi:hypothetical protein
MDERDTPQTCALCQRLMTRQLTGFGITREHVIQRQYEFEQDKWALATGIKHETAADFEAWAKANNKTILAPGETIKKIDNLPEDREIEKTLDKVYEKNHDLGSVK